MSETGRRSASRRLSVNPTVVIGAALVLATVGALSLVDPHEAGDRTAAPQESTLTTASVGCPAALEPGAPVLLATGRDEVDGTVGVTTGGGAPVEVALRSGEVTAVEGEDPVGVTGEARLAPGLLGARFGTRRLAAADCPPPSPETWFTGVGAGARHDSVIELVNPDGGPAVADITVYGRGGEIDVPRLRGITVPGHDSLRLELGQVAPRRSELALHVVVQRGRIAASLLDVFPEIGARELTQDWMTGQSEPTTSATLLGLPTGSGSDVLAVANPGDSEARVEVQVVTADSLFAPADVDELRLPPGSVRTVSLGAVLRDAVDDGALGVRVTSSAPVTSTLRSVVDDDLSHAAHVSASTEPMTLLVPPGSGRVVLADASGVGVAVVEAWDADGAALDSTRVELKPGQGGEVDLPRGAALVRVSTRRAGVMAAVVVTAPARRGGPAAPAGTAVLGFRELLTRSLVPDVRPGL